jgi:hypothetical protein
MSAIDYFVVRDGKWVSSTKTESVPGEICVDVSDGFGFYAYELGRVPEENAQVILGDAKDNDKERADFDSMLVTKGLPKFFGEEEE